MLWYLSTPPSANFSDASHLSGTDHILAKAYIQYQCIFEDEKQNNSLNYQPPHCMSHTMNESSISQWQIGFVD